MADISRRSALKRLGGTTLATAVPIIDALGQTPGATNARAMPSPGGATPRTTYLFFNHEEAAFIEAAVVRLIPADEQWDGALEAGVPNFIDKQLGGAWGAGERLYRSGPWQPGTPSQGYQLPFTPAELFRKALAAINNELAKAGTPFATMSGEQQDEYLHGLEAGGKNLDGAPSDVFFASLWQCTVEGFFSDPVYGGNRDMLGWRMIGFPGAYASYYDLVDKHGIKINREPMSLAQDVHGHVHPDPNIPAYSPPSNR
jgi:gluconate 2-dehydrogenase gamma chain